MHVEPTLPTQPSRRHGRCGRARRARHAAAIRLVGGVGALVVGGVGLLTGAVRRVVVVGDSMVPALSEGDRVVVVRTPRWLRLRAGDVVAAPDPRAPARLLVKRVGACTPTGAVVLLGDNPARSTDSRDFGAVERRSVWGLVVYRYAPAGRNARIARGRPAVSSPASWSHPRARPRGG